METLKGEGAEIIVCLSHSGTGDSLASSEDEELAKAVDGIDVIVSGHTHSTLAEPLVVNDTYIVSSGPYCQNLGSLTFSWDDGGEKRLLDYRLIPIDETVAENPEIAAATHCHLPHPRGVKIHARALPRIAIRQFSVSSTIPNAPFSKPKVERIHMITQARNRIVPAFLMKPHRRSQVCIRTVLADGMWYAGNSITNGAASPENGFVFFNMIAATRTQTIPNAYIKNAVFPASE